MKLFSEWFLENELPPKKTLPEVLNELITLRDNATSDYDREVYQGAVDFLKDYIAKIQ